MNFQKTVFRSNGIGKQKKLDGMEENDISEDWLEASRVPWLCTSLGYSQSNKSNFPLSS